VTTLGFMDHAIPFAHFFVVGYAKFFFHTVKCYVCK
jgi:hypothetical protein